MPNDSARLMRRFLLDVLALHFGVDDDRRRVGVPAPLVGVLRLPDLVERSLVDPAVRRRVTGGGERVVRQQQRRSGLGYLLRERADRRRSLGVWRDVANVDRENAAGELAHERAIDLGILLTAVADENEGQRGIGAEDLANLRQLVRPRAQ